MEFSRLEKSGVAVILLLCWRTPGPISFVRDPICTVQCLLLGDSTFCWRFVLFYTRLQYKHK